jgi:hypothetical protein
MCRKIPFVRLIHRIAAHYPQYFNFLPKTYVLPMDNAAFMHAVDRHDRDHIFKPDGGSLGRGIHIIDKSDTWEPLERFAVAQEYLDSYTIDDRKFDLRLYVLIASISPLRIYIYRNGVARFCTESPDSHSRFGFLTNTHVNAKNPEAEPEQMTQMISEVFARLHKEGRDIDRLWTQIDQAIILTIISAYGFLARAAAQEVPDVGYSRCFQIIGCDVLLDRSLKPYVLEINYRPSLKCNTAKGHSMKLKMLQDAIRLACPYQPLQALIASSDVPDDIQGYREFIKGHKSVIDQCEKLRRRNDPGNGFDLVFSSDRKSQWNAVLDTVKTLSTDVTLDMGMPEKYMLWKQPTE